MKTYYIYMMSNYSDTVLYIGITNNLVRRVLEHKTGSFDGFTKEYHCNKLVWYNYCEDIKAIIEQEKRMKKWKREYKENLINEKNPMWNDLFEQIKE